MKEGQPDPKRPPVYTKWEELLGWTLDRTASIPKSQRFTFGQRIDGHALDVMELLVQAIFAKEKLSYLGKINRRLELLRVLWRLVQKRGWISLRQLHYIQSQLDETGRMIGGWRRQVLTTGKGEEK